MSALLDSDGTPLSIGGNANYQVPGTATVEAIASDIGVWTESAAHVLVQVAEDDGASSEHMRQSIYAALHLIGFANQAANAVAHLGMRSK